MKALGKAFVAGYISIAEGEKDPRNLLTAFAIARVILIEFDISDHVEVCALHLGDDYLIQLFVHSRCLILHFAISQSLSGLHQMIPTVSPQTIFDWH